MAINIKFDLAGNPEPPTIVLGTRSGKKLGRLDFDEDSLDLNDRFNDVFEFSFTLNKYVNNKLTNLWDKVVNFKLVWCKEWDMWFEITVELDEETETIKTVFCTQLGKAELSQLKLYNIEINTEDDIDRDDYKATILYNEEDTEASLLHRLLKDKAPHYSIIHVDSTIKNIQRTFSFDDTSIDDAFQEIAEEIGCLFVYPSNSDEYGKVQRTIAVYDLQQNCLNDECNYRGEFTDICPKCGGSNIRYGYGDDTLIFVTADELANGGIQLSTDTDSVKNCFRLEAGDDLMTATIRNCNPNGTNYIWYFSDENKEDMSEELSNGIDNYNVVYKEYYDNYESVLDANLLSDYNSLIDKYLQYNDELEAISSPVVGYSSLMTAYYNTIDLSLYLESSLMPNVEIGDKSKCSSCSYEGFFDGNCPKCGSENILSGAKYQASLLTTSALSPVAVSDIDIVSLSTTNSAVLAMAKIIVKSTYKVEISNSELIKNNNGTATWNGIFTITNYSDEEDIATTEKISVIVNDDEESYIKQKIEKALNKDNTENYSISGLFEKEYNDFCVELKKYALNPLINFRDSCQGCLDILTEQGIGNDEEDDLYIKLYEPYYNKLIAIDNEILIRENEISIVKGTYYLNGVLIKKGLQQCIEECKILIQDALNFENFLGDDLWFEFCSYRREDKYSNDNYISDGLSNAELFEKAMEFIEVAENEIYKSSELQHSISTSLNNLLAIEKFKPLIESFKVGNWIRVQIDNKIYKLRLLEYNINFGSFDSISVEFSDVTKIKNGITDVQNVLSQASSMATNYSSIQRQAKQGDDAKATVDDFLTTGLNTALVQIQNNDNEEVTLTKNGLLARSYNDITDDYSDEQLKITHNIFAYTDNNWKTIKLALGKHDYQIYDKEEKDFIDKTGYGLSADFVTAGVVSGSQIIGGDIYSSNYSESDKTGSWLNLLDGTFSFAGGSLTYDGDHLAVDGEITVATAGTIGCWNVNNFSIYKDSDVFGSSDGMYFGTKGLSLGSAFIVDSSGKATATNADIKGTIKADKGYIGNLTLDNGSLYNGTTSMSSTTAGIYLGKDGFRQYNNANAYVNIQNGIISANGANIGGTITATSGTIGAIDIVTNRTTTLHAYSNSLSTSATVDMPILYLTESSDSGKSYATTTTSTSIQGGIKKVYGENELLFYIKAKPASTSTWTGADDANIFFVRTDGYTLTRGLKVITPDCLLSTTMDGDTRYDDSTFDYYFIKTDDNYIKLDNVKIVSNGIFSSLVPADDDDYKLGTSDSRWSQIWSKNALNTTSDRNLKKDISELNETHKQFFMKLIPVSFMFTDPESDRTHIGFIAQDVERAMMDCGLTSLDFAGLCKDVKREKVSNNKHDKRMQDVYDENGNPVYIYSLRYTEFIGIITYVLQDTVERLDKLEELVNQLITN